jgi:hypothetical protein
MYKEIPVKGGRKNQLRFCYVRITDFGQCRPENLRLKEVNKSVAKRIILLSLLLETVMYTVQLQFQDMHALLFIVHGWP